MDGESVSRVAEGVHPGWGRERRVGTDPMVES